MKCQANEMISLHGIKLIKWEIGKLTSWWNCKVVNLQVDKILRWRNCTLMKWQVDEILVDEAPSLTECQCLSQFKEDVFCLHFMLF
jgi:hypothetical protein